MRRRITPPQNELGNSYSGVELHVPRWSVIVALGASAVGTLVASIVANVNDPGSTHTRRDFTGIVCEIIPPQDGLDSIAMGKSPTVDKRTDHQTPQEAEADANLYKTYSDFFDTLSEQKKVFYEELATERGVDAKDLIYKTYNTPHVIDGNVNGNDDNGGFGAYAFSRNFAKFYAKLAGVDLGDDEWQETLAKSPEYQDAIFEAVYQRFKGYGLNGIPLIQRVAEEWNKDGVAYVDGTAMNYPNAVVFKTQFYRQIKGMDTKTALQLALQDAETGFGAHQSGTLTPPPVEPTPPQPPESNSWGWRCKPVFSPRTTHDDPFHIVPFIVPPLLLPRWRKGRTLRVPQLSRQTPPTPQPKASSRLNAPSSVNQHSNIRFHPSQHNGGGGSGTRGQHASGPASKNRERAGRGRKTESRRRQH